MLKGFASVCFRFLTPTFFLVVLAAAPFYRAILVEEANGEKIRCQGCFFWQVVRADSLIVLSCAVLLLLAIFLRSRWLSTPFRVGFLGLLFFYVFDMYVFDSFNNRLYLSDIGRYFSPELIASFINSYLFASPGIQIATVVSLAFCVGLLFVGLERWFGAVTGVLSVLAGVFLVWHLAVPSPTYVHGWAIDSAFVRNLPTGEKKVISDESLARYAPVFAAGETVEARTTEANEECRPGLNLSPNIIVLIIESWSSWQSELFSGLENWMPGLDAIARQHLYSRQFYANGYKTNEGLVAFFTGLQPMPAMQPEFEVPSFHAYRGLDQTLPTALAEHNYQSHFITSGDLAFSNKRDWLESVEFDYIEGYEYPGYKGLPRFTFGAVADAVLYSRILKMITGDPQKQRFKDLWPGGLAENSAASDEKRMSRNALYQSFPYELDIVREIERVGASYLKHTGELVIGAEGVTLEVNHSDPYFKFPELKLAGDRDYRLEVTLDVPAATTAQLFFKSGENNRFQEQYSLAAVLQPGENSFSFSFAIGEAPGSLRFDPGYSPGRYALKALKLYSKPHQNNDTSQDASPLQAGKPYFIAIETVSTHQPFTDPMTFEKSFKAPFVYADKAASEFYEALVESDFFDNGVLIITSDHRSMTPLSAQEIDYFGLSASARVPLVVAAPMLGRIGEIPGAFEQRDLLGSLLHVVSDETCGRDAMGNMLAEAPPDQRCIMHHRGDRRDHLDVFCGEAEGTIKLDGDDTRVVSGEGVGQAVDAIHRQRTEAYLRVSQ